ncbi:MAG: ABC transporter ATP-binding protein [Flavobacteriales bacterium]|nr:ABC transporter ATP-binding protein [Flavobacteriales bacterium]
MIRIEDLKKSFGKNCVLNGLDLEIEKGGVFVILGPNGSGKTTLIKSILGMVNPDSGQISINNRSVLRQWAYRSDIDYLPQIANFPANLSVAELIRLVEDLRHKPTRSKELIHLFGLQEYLGSKLHTLSGGTRQKVNLVLTFMFNSELVILDEPTSGLDPVALLRLKELIRKERANGKTIIITTHIMSFVEEVAERIVFLLDGTSHYEGSLQGIYELTGQSNLEEAIAQILQQQYAQDNLV